MAAKPTRDCKPMEARLETLYVLGLPTPHFNDGKRPCNLKAPSPKRFRRPSHVAPAPPAACSPGSGPLGLGHGATGAALLAFRAWRVFTRFVSMFQGHGGLGTQSEKQKIWRSHEIISERTCAGIFVSLAVGLLLPTIFRLQN